MGLKLFLIPFIVIVLESALISKISNHLLVSFSIIISILSHPLLSTWYEMVSTKNRILESLIYGYSLLEFFIKGGFKLL